MQQIPPPKIKQIFLWGLGFLFCIFLDQIGKFLVKEPFRNYFFAFSIQLPVWVMYGIYFVAMGAIIKYLVSNFFNLGFFNKLAWVLIFTGAVLNIVERLILGYVRDFIYITFSRWTGVYNLADGYIIVGVIILLFSHKKFSN
ncbi:MAG: signal peptidase II [Candidatus Doudnabacteria bacterium]|jgi:lipoprotein signal peptidase